LQIVVAVDRLRGFDVEDSEFAADKGKGINCARVAVVVVHDTAFNKLRRHLDIVLFPKVFESRDSRRN